MTFPPIGGEERRTRGRGTPSGKSANGTASPCVTRLSAGRQDEAAVRPAKNLRLRALLLVRDLRRRSRRRGGFRRRRGPLGFPGAVAPVARPIEDVHAVLDQKL